KVRFESADFDREFTVLCADRRFATALIDQRLMAWLLDGVPRSVVFEVSGRYVLGSKRDGTEEGTEIIQVFPAVAGFISRVPPVVSSLYPQK
ncbi:MAG TPA: hypothetical protein VF660_02000, partial [Actinomycetota bacterium]